MTFINDLASGVRAQIEFAKVLLDTRKIISLEFSQGKFSDWDIKTNEVPEGEVTYEVKSDRQAGNTGNFVIEHHYKGKPSGIYTSKADYIVYYVKGEWWIQERGELILRLIDTEKENVKGGDGWQSAMWKIKCIELPNLFSKIKTNGQGGEENA